MERMKVIRVTEYEAEFSDGQILPHVVKLDSVPTVEEYQVILDELYTKLVPQDMQEPPKEPEAK